MTAHVAEQSFHVTTSKLFACYEEMKRHSMPTGRLRRGESAVRAPVGRIDDFRISRRSDYSEPARFELALVELGVLEEYVERRGHRGIQAAAAVAKAAAQDVEVEKSPHRVGEHLDRREGGRLLFHRAACREAIYRRDVIRDVAIAEVQDRIRKLPEAAFDDDLVMRVAPA